MKETDYIKTWLKKNLSEERYLHSLGSAEAAQKLAQMKPESVGRASRISGVSPADCEVLLVYLEQRRRSNDE